MNPIPMLTSGFLELCRISAHAAVLVLVILFVYKLVGVHLTAYWRHAIWFLLLVRLLLPFSFDSSLNPLNLMGVRVNWLSFDSKASPQKTQAAAYISNQENQRIENQPQDGAQNQSLDIERNTSLNPSIARQRASAQNRFGVVELASCIWLLGFLISLGCTALRTIRFSLRLKDDPVLVDPEILAVFNHSRRLMKVEKNIPILTTDRVDTPALCGWLNPKILVPRRVLESFSSNELQHLFLHELTHLKRRDIAANWVMTFLQTLHWFNPSIAYGFYRLRCEREVVRDAMVLSVLQGDESAQYGQTVIHMAAHFRQIKSTPAMAGIFETKSNLRRRIEMISQGRQSTVFQILLSCLIFAFIGGIALTDASGGDVGIMPIRLSSGEELIGLGTPQFSSYDPAAFSADGRYFAVTTAEGAFVFESEGENVLPIRFFEFQNSVYIEDKNEYWQEQLLAARFSPDSKTVIGFASLGTIVQWDMESGQIVNLFDKLIINTNSRYMNVEQGAYRGMAISDNGNRIAAFTGKSYYVYDFQEDRILHSYTLDQSYLRFLGVPVYFYDSAGDRIVVAKISYENSPQTSSIFNIVNLNNSETEKTITLSRSPINISIVPETKKIVLGYLENNEINEWFFSLESLNLETEETENFFPEPVSVDLYHTDYFGNHRYFVLNSGKDSITSWKDKLGSMPPQPTESSARIFDLQTKEWIAELPDCAYRFQNMVFPPDGQKILTVGNDKSVRLWDLQTQKEIKSIPDFRGPLNSADMSPDGSAIVTTYCNLDYNGLPVADLWDVKTGRRILTLERHADRVNSAVFSPDGKYILTGSDDKTAKLWDSASGQEIYTFGEHDTYVNDVDFSPDGTKIATAQGNRDISNPTTNTIVIWNVQSKEPVLEFNGHTNSVWHIQFSHDGKSIISNGDDNKARIWNVETGEELYSFASSGRATATLSPDGRYASIPQKNANDNFVDLSTRRKATEFTQAMRNLKIDSYTVNFSADGSLLFVGGHILDSETYEEIGSCPNGILDVGDGGRSIVTKNGIYNLSPSSEVPFWRRY